MSDHYFKCTPGKECPEGTCCKGEDTNPLLYISDYVRLAKGLNRTPAYIWNQFGNIHIYRNSEMPQHTFSLHLGLLHDPCPLLNSELLCDVYDYRPFSCVVFPLDIIYLDHDKLPEELKDYRCLQNLKLSQKQNDAFKSFIDIVREVDDIEERVLWQGIKREVYLSNSKEVFNYMSEALSMQESRDPKNRSLRTLTLVQDIDNLSDLISSQVPFRHNTFRRLANTIFYAILKDTIAERMEAMDTSTTEQLDPLLEKISQVTKEFS